jgi:hypothetical protein
MIIRDDNQQGPDMLSPGVNSSYGNGMNKLSKYFFNLLLVVIVAFLFGIPIFILNISYYFNYSIEVTMLWMIFIYIYEFLVTAPLQYGVSYVYLKAARDEKPEVKDLTKVLDNYWHIVLANVICGIIVSVGFLLLIIPGIYFLCKLAFVRYLVVEEKMSALDAIDASWKMTDGHADTIFLMGLLAIPIFIAGLVLFGVGVILSNMWVETALASMYHAVSLEKGIYKAGTGQSEQGRGPSV